MKTKILKHNGLQINDYPEDSWYLVPFPKQKGIPYNSDNLATVNRASFLSDNRFSSALKVAEKRWEQSGFIRDISWRLHVFLWAFGTAQKMNDENTISVECGTGKGYMAAAACEFFEGCIGMEFYLLDSFRSTMPNIDGDQLSTGKQLFAYADGKEEVERYFSNVQAIKIIEGIIPDSLKELPTERKINFLHMDLNSAKAERSALEELKSRFVKGTIILFDDYGGPGGELQSHVHDKFAEQNDKQLLILPTGQAIIIW